MRRHVVSMKMIVTDDKQRRVADIHFQVRVSARARRLSLKITLHGKVEVVVPRGVAMSVADSFVMKQQAWVHQKRAQVLSDETLDRGLPEVIVLPLINRQWQIQYRASAHQKIVAIGLEGRKTLRVYADTDEKRTSLLQGWLSTKARLLLPSMLSAVSLETGLQYKTVAIRAQKTRWASCSSRGHISLNRSILFLSPRQANYLFVHELTHTIQMNHGAEFWKRVADEIPDYKLFEKQLNEVSRSIPLWALKL